ncbi:MAG: bifunctional methylenetetrahydrofolate dehydrogenase/methenyltetrahydrofolate cyclohydrolase FolD [Nitrospirae bacterium]|nr:bifunctional methylenetetrahydrofolate dehydrogenase/methenyltetrahydrofolate cyclohydrolase FolD [Nitrospirota bacterium]MBI3595287.1 bifunctional methylenetetrahydrofolate dehydrogenase/methenyltetrahydrofolate cyclohydrolase FolD [Nitrospirota bacterium]
MTAKIIDGKSIGLEIRNEIASQVKKLASEGVVPGLATVLVGNNPASQVYVRNKRKLAVEAGMYSEFHELGPEAKEEELLKLIDRLNGDPKIHGILVQLPLPRHLDERKIIDRLSPDKDVDGLHPMNAGRLVIGTPGFIPCTPFGVMKLLDYMKVKIEGSNAVVIGRSILVGKPVALLLLQRNATVTICHSKSANLSSIVLQADIVIAAVGKSKMVTEEMIKPGATIIDVGINRTLDGKLVGDVDFEGVSRRAGMITPVPGGVGPMTIAMLLQNTLYSTQRRLRSSDYHDNS